MSEEIISRQVKYQRKKRAEGKCIRCGLNKRLKSKPLCDNCGIIQRESQRAYFDFKGKKTKPQIYLEC